MTMKSIDKRIERGRRVAALLCLTAATSCCACTDPVLANVVAGLRDGAITTATGLINTFFDQQGASGASIAGEGGGDDLFAQM